MQRVRLASYDRRRVRISVKSEQRKGTMPHGNTDWGKDYYHNDEQGKVSNLGRTYTGTGPVTWNHDHTPYGVSDLNGNVWEWLAGLRIKDGVIEFIPDNKAASPYCDLSKDSAEWQQAETSKGPVRANVECGEITITDAVAADDYEPDYDGVRIEKLEVELSEIPQVLKDLGIIPDKEQRKRERPMYTLMPPRANICLSVGRRSTILLRRVRPLSA